MNFKDVLREKLYAQTCNSTPLSLMAAAESGFLMEKQTGLRYKGFFFSFKKNYGSIFYFVDDLDRLAVEIEAKLKEDKDFFVNMKKLYDERIKASKIFFNKVDNHILLNLDITSLLHLLKQSCEEISWSVGVGHIIEPFSLVTDLRIKQELSRYIASEKDLNKAFSILMAPIRKSFVNEYEESLRGVKSGNKTFDEHKNDFFWIRNGYAGRYDLTEQDTEKEMQSLKNESFNFEQLIEEKKQIISKYSFNEELVYKIRATEFITTWQDERKKNILISIDYMERILKAISNKINIDIGYLRYLTVQEIKEETITSSDIKAILIERYQGGCYLHQKTGTKVLSGSDYDIFINQFNKEQKQDVKEISGTTASIGTVIGRVKVLTTVESMQKLEEGDILVASMTRPELVPAMKRAAAVITDEGGITCHAAIVSRELGIPCIIGTKIATKVLKDGDLVEIKGNHGLIIILKKAK